MWPGNSLMVRIRGSWAFALGRNALFNVLVPGSATAGTTDISTFFGTLTKDLVAIALTMAGFFFVLSALFYMASGATGNERTRQHAVSALYAALAGLALALLGVSIATLVKSAVPGA